MNPPYGAAEIWQWRIQGDAIIAIGMIAHPNYRLIGAIGVKRTHPLPN